MTDLAIPASQSPSRFVEEWERQQGEPPRAWKAFVIYRDMGDDRGVVKVRDVAGGIYKHSTLLGWAEKFRWVERARAWDNYVDRRRQAAFLKEQEEMARRHITTGRKLQDVGLSYVDERLEDPEVRAKEMSAASALRFIDTGVALERKGMGVDDEQKQADLNVQVNVLDAGTKGDVFAKIGEMARNIAAVRQLSTSPPPSEPVEEPEIVDGEVVEDDETE
jgi:hypothetical protein